MRQLSILTVWLVASCTAANDEPHRSTLDTIEQKVVLPPGAEPTGRYSRYYAQRANGKVQAAYVIHDAAFRDDVQRFCATQDPGRFPCSGGKSQLAVAGTRIWLADVTDLPVRSGGGCSAIQFDYDPATGNLSPPECNGDY